MKFFALPKHAPWKQLTHIDAYRLEKPEELVTIGWKEYAKNPDNLIVVEWPEKIQKLIPKGSIKVKLAYVGNRRSISF
jgi:tRNA threonylcarbamoyladenosine biosynthesis protein TsaE